MVTINCTGIVFSWRTHNQPHTPAVDSQHRLANASINSTAFHCTRAQHLLCMCSGAAATSEPKLLAEAGPSETDFSSQRSKELRNKDSSSVSLTTFNPMPRFSDGCYLFGILVIFGALFATFFCTEVEPGSNMCVGWNSLLKWRYGSVDYTTIVPVVVAWGPVIWGLILHYAFGDRLSIMWPFHKEPLLVTVGHLVVGTLFCQVVVFQVLAMYFDSPYKLITPVLIGAP